MEQAKFDNWARLLASLGSRRAAAWALAGGALGAGLDLLGWGRAATACRKPGKACARGHQCCSGACKQHKCRGVAGRCTLARDYCLVGLAASICDVDGAGTCNCMRRVNGAAFCSDVARGGCRDCAGDGDCAREFGADSVCVRARDCGCTSNVTACALPCPTPA